MAMLQFYYHVHMNSDFLEFAHLMLYIFSVNDLDSSVNELVRLVRVYSTPWEEKSAALKKLHEDYEIKQRQLNIAIKRLQLVDTHVSH